MDAPAEIKTYRIEGPCFEAAVTSFGRSSQRKVGGFFVVNPQGKRVRAFRHPNEFKRWNPAWEAALREKAQAWADECNARI